MLISFYFKFTSGKKNLVSRLIHLATDSFSDIVFLFGILGMGAGPLNSENQHVKYGNWEKLKCV